MKDLLASVGNRRIGIAFSGGSVRGLAHIGVIKALAAAGIRPAVVAGTSVGSIIGAAYAGGLDWRGLAEMAENVFWPALLNAGGLENFCRRYLPETFAQLPMPFAAVATRFPDRATIAIKTGALASAISASCAIRVLRRPVIIDGQRLKDGGFSCVLPAEVCREMGADFIIAVDVWAYGSLLRRIGEQHSRLAPAHYRNAIASAQLIVQPDIPITGYLPGRAAVARMIAIGEAAAERAIQAFQSKI